MTQNRMQHVRDHLVAMMEALADKDVEPDVIERAKATAALAQTFTNTVKVELDYRRATGLENGMPDVLKSAELPPAGVARRVIDGAKR